MCNKSVTHNASHRLLSAFKHTMQFSCVCAVALCELAVPKLTVKGRWSSGLHMEISMGEKLKGLYRVMKYSYLDITLLMNNPCCSGFLFVLTNFYRHKLQNFLFKTSPAKKNHHLDSLISNIIRSSGRQKLCLKCQSLSVKVLLMSWSNICSWYMKEKAWFKHLVTCIASF